MSDGKIIISGAGRSGTTFLVQLLTELGMNTGFESSTEGYQKDVRAGMEFMVEVEGTAKEIKKFFNDSTPKIIKSPYMSFWLSTYLENDMIDVEHIIVPVRDIDEVANSRVNTGLQIGNDVTVQGQGLISLQALALIVTTATLNDVPLTLMNFPKIVKDVDYCYSKLKEVFKDEMPSKRKFISVFNNVAKPRRIKTKVHKEVLGKDHLFKIVTG